VVYESPNRLVNTLGELEHRGHGSRTAVVAREMTKQFEEVRRGTVSELRAHATRRLRLPRSLECRKNWRTGWQWKRLERMNRRMARSVWRVADSLAGP